MAVQPGFFQVGGKWYFRNAQGNTAAAKAPSGSEVVLKGSIPLHPAPAAAAPAAPAPTPAPVAPAATTPPLVPGANDPTYFEDESGNYQQLQGQANPLAAQLAGLQSKDANGLTQYDYAQQAAQKSNATAQYSGNANLAARGIFQSSSRDQQDQNLSQQYAQQSQQLDSTLGATAQGALKTQLGNIGHTYGYTPTYDPTTGQYTGMTGTGQGGAPGASGAELAAQTASTLRQQAMGGAPDPTAPAAAAAATAGAPAQAYSKGFYQQGGKWYYQNATGAKAAAPNYKPGHNTVISGKQIKV